LKPKKPNRTQTGKNRVKLKKLSQTGFYPKKPNRTETGWFEPVSVWLLFYIKTEPNKK
jgi:hypothetical protein